MASGYAANFALVVEEEKLKGMNLGSYSYFLEVLEENKITLDSYAVATKTENVIYNKFDKEVDNPEIVDNAFELFQDEFKEKTGIGIIINYHSTSNEGDRYDNVDGFFFCLEYSDVYQLTPRAESLKKLTDFDMKYFVTYG